MAKLIISPRRAGKTTEMVEWFLEDPHHRAIVCMRHDKAVEARALADRGVEGGLLYHLSKRIVGLQTAATELRGLDVDEIAIDEIGPLLGEILETKGIPIRLVSLATLSVGDGAYLFEDYKVKRLTWI